MDLKVRVDINFARVDVNFQTVLVTKFHFRFFLFILISLSTKVPLIIHTKFQPNIPSHSGEKVDFNGFAIFSISGHLVFSTRLLHCCCIVVLRPR